MPPKPLHLTKKYADQFQDASVADSYRFRPEYPAETFEILSALIPDGPRSVLDIGCGTGFIARRLVDYVDRVDAVDISSAMIERGRALYNGAHKHLKWISSSVEEAEVRPPYGLITAGQSLHWMEWAEVFPRFHHWLVDDGNLAIVGMVVAPSPWDADLQPLIARYSTNRDFKRTDLVEELVQRELFTPIGDRTTKPVSFTQPITEYVESFHARNGFSRERMTSDDARAFDEQAYKIIASYSPDSSVTQAISGHIIWGRPRAA